MNLKKKLQHLQVNSQNDKNCKKIENMKGEIQRITNEKEKIQKKLNDNEQQIKHLKVDISKMKNNFLKTSTLLKEEQRKHTNIIRKKENIITKLHEREEHYINKLKKKEEISKQAYSKLLKRNQELNEELKKLKKNRTNSKTGKINTKRRQENQTIGFTNKGTNSGFAATRFQKLVLERTDTVPVFPVDDHNYANMDGGQVSKDRSHANMDRIHANMDGSEANVDDKDEDDEYSVNSPMYHNFEVKDDFNASSLSTILSDDIKSVHSNSDSSSWKTEKNNLSLHSRFKFNMSEYKFQKSLKNDIKIKSYLKEFLKKKKKLNSIKAKLDKEKSMNRQVKKILQALQVKKKNEDEEGNGENCLVKDLNIRTEEKSLNMSNNGSVCIYPDISGEELLEKKLFHKKESTLEFNSDRQKECNDKSQSNKEMLQENSISVNDKSGEENLKISLCDEKIDEDVLYYENKLKESNEFIKKLKRDIITKKEEFILQKVVKHLLKKLHFNFKKRKENEKKIKSLKKFIYSENLFISNICNNFFYLTNVTNNSVATIGGNPYLNNPMTIPIYSNQINNIHDEKSNGWLNITCTEKNIKNRNPGIGDFFPIYKFDQVNGVLPRSIHGNVFLNGKKRNTFNTLREFDSSFEKKKNNTNLKKRSYKSRLMENIHLNNFNKRRIVLSRSNDFIENGNCETKRGKRYSDGFYLNKSCSSYPEFNATISVQQSLDMTHNGYEQINEIPSERGKNINLNALNILCDNNSGIEKEEQQMMHPTKDFDNNIDYVTRPNLNIKRKTIDNCYIYANKENGCNFLDYYKDVFSRDHYNINDTNSDEKENKKDFITHFDLNQGLSFNKSEEQQYIGLPAEESQSFLHNTKYDKNNICPIDSLKRSYMTNKESNNETFSNDKNELNETKRLGENVQDKESNFLNYKSPHASNMIEKKKKSRELNRELDRELNRELDRELNRELDRELNRELDRELNRELDQELNRKLDQELNRELDQELNQALNGALTNMHINGEDYHMGDKGKNREFPIGDKYKTKKNFEGGCDISLCENKSIQNAEGMKGNFFYTCTSSSNQHFKENKLDFICPPRKMSRSGIFNKDPNRNGSGSNSRNSNECANLNKNENDYKNEKNTMNKTTQSLNSTSTDGIKKRQPKVCTIKSKSLDENKMVHNTLSNVKNTCKQKENKLNDICSDVPVRIMRGTNLTDAETKDSERIELTELAKLVKMVKTVKNTENQNDSTKEEYKTRRKNISLNAETKLVKKINVNNCSTNQTEEKAHHNVLVEKGDNSAYKIGGIMSEMDSSAIAQWNSSNSRNDTKCENFYNYGSLNERGEMTLSNDNLQFGINGEEFKKIEKIHEESINVFKNKMNNLNINNESFDNINMIDKQFKGKLHSCGNYDVHNCAGEFANSNTNIQKSYKTVCIKNCHKYGVSGLCVKGSNSKGLTFLSSSINNIKLWDGKKNIWNYDHINIKNEKSTFINSLIISFQKNCFFSGINSYVHLFDIRTNPVSLQKYYYSDKNDGSLLISLLNDKSDYIPFILQNGEMSTFNNTKEYIWNDNNSTDVSCTYEDLHKSEQMYLGEDINVDSKANASSMKQEENNQRNNQNKSQKNHQTNSINNNKIDANEEDAKDKLKVIKDVENFQSEYCICACGNENFIKVFDIRKNDENMWLAKIPITNKIEYITHIPIKRNGRNVTKDSNILKNVIIASRDKTVKIWKKGWVSFYPPSYDWCTSLSNFNLSDLIKNKNNLNIMERSDEYANNFFNYDSLIVSGSRDSHLRFWLYATDNTTNEFNRFMKIIKNAHMVDITSISKYQTNALVTTDRDGYIQMWDCNLLINDNEKSLLDMDIYNNQLNLAVNKIGKTLRHSSNAINKVVCYENHFLTASSDGSIKIFCEK